MPALANSLRRIWSAKNRVPHLTGWGTPGSLSTAAKEAFIVSSAYALALELPKVTRQIAPTISLFVWNIFR